MRERRWPQVRQTLSLRSSAFPLESQEDSGAGSEFELFPLQRRRASGSVVLGVGLSVWDEQVSLLQDWSERELLHRSPYEANCSTANDRRWWVQPHWVVDNSDFSPIRLTVPSDSSYDEEAFHITPFK